MYRILFLALFTLACVIPCLAQDGTDIDPPPLSAEVREIRPRLREEIAAAREVAAERSDAALMRLHMLSSENHRLYSAETARILRAELRQWRLWEEALLPMIVALLYRADPESMDTQRTIWKIVSDRSVARSVRRTILDAYMYAKFPSRLARPQDRREAAAVFRKLLNDSEGIGLRFALHAFEGLEALGAVGKRDVEQLLQRFERATKRELGGDMRLFASVTDRLLEHGGLWPTQRRMDAVISTVQAVAPAEARISLARLRVENGIYTVEDANAYINSALYAGRPLTPHVSGEWTRRAARQPSFLLFLQKHAENLVANGRLDAPVLLGLHDVVEDAYRKRFAKCVVDFYELNARAKWRRRLDGPREFREDSLPPD